MSPDHTEYPHEYISLEPYASLHALEATQRTPRRRGRKEYFRIKLKHFYFLRVLCASATSAFVPQRLGRKVF